MEYTGLTLAFLGVEVALVALIVLTLFHFRRRIGLTPLFLFIGSHQYLQTVLAATVYLPLIGPYSTSPGSSVLFTSSLFALLLVYLREDVPQTRRVIYGIVFANAMLTLLSLLTHVQMKSGIAINILQVPTDLFQINPRIFIAGTIALLCDSILVIIVYEFLFLRVNRLPLFPRVLIALLVVVYFDSFVFSILSFAGTPLFWNILVGQLLGKTFTGLLFGTLLFAYLRFVDDVATGGTQRELRDVFSILTYRERYEQIRTEKEEQERKHEMQIRESEDRYRTLFEGSHDAILLIDEQNHRVLRANPAAATLLGRDAEAIIGKPLITLVGGSASRELEPALRKLPDFREITVERPDGTTASIEFFGTTHVEQGQRMYQCYFRDVTARVRAEKQLSHDAFHDRLTGLPNRALFTDRLERLLAHRQPRPFAVLFLDLDRFKNVNDSLGHVLGDALLIAVGERMTATTRGSDSIARLGGDEFGFILDDIATIDQANRAAERIQEIFSEPFDIQSNEMTITASCGIVLHSEGYKRPEEMLRDADTAMYRAKAAGRSQHVIFDTPMHQRVVEFLQIESGLRSALARSEITVHYQPIFDLRSGLLAGVEALARWNREGSIVSPSDFIPVAEETGLIVPIGEHVLAIACAQTEEWRVLVGRDLFVAVNFSSRQFQKNELGDVVAHILTTTGLPARFLQIEITESVLMESNERTLAVIAQLRALGVSFAIDDFGTGWSSLSYLKKLPIDVLKIDRSFILDIQKEDDDAAIPTAIVSLASSLMLEVVAEGVETAVQLERLRRLGCGYAQGYLLARPAPAAEITRRLREAAHIIELLDATAHD